MEGKVYFFPVGKTRPCLQSHKVVNDCLNTNEWEALMGENAEADNSFLFAFTDAFTVQMYTVNVFISGPWTYECQSPFNVTTGLSCSSREHHLDNQPQSFCYLEVKFPQLFKEN